jgi:hypothetical protein
VTEDKIAWGNYFALTYTIPRKHLQLYGAPRSPYAKSFSLPERPWGNEADDVFQSPYPVNKTAASMQDLLNEKADTDTSARIWSKWSKNPSDEMFLKYLQHPEFGYRRAIMNRVISNNRTDLITAMLSSPDARMRYNGLISLTGFYKGSKLSDEKVTPEMLALVERMLASRTEAWWNRITAIQALQRGGAPLVAKHKKLLLKYLTVDDWWFQSAALESLMLIATDPEQCRDVLPAIADLLGKTRRARILMFSKILVKKLPKAKPEVQELAVNVLREAFLNVPPQFADAYTGYIPPNGAAYARRSIANVITRLPGGAELGRTDPKMTLAWKRSGNDDDMYVYSGTFESNPALISKWLKQIEVDADKIETVPAGVAKWKRHRENILKEMREKAKKRGKKFRKSGPLWRRIDQPYLELKGDGLVAGDKLLFWSGDMLIDNRLGEARKMLLQSFGDETYLLVEKGGFEETERPDMSDEEEDYDSDQGSDEDQDWSSWHCGYEVYERVE